MVVRIRVIDTGDIAANATVEKHQAEEVDLTLKRLQVVEASNQSLEKVFIAVWIEDRPITMPNASAKIFAAPYAELPEFNVRVRAGQKLIFRITNGESSTRRLLIHVYYE